MFDPPKVSVRDVQQIYDPQASTYERQFRNRKLRTRLAVRDARQVELTRDLNRVLDLGCGTGRVLAQLESAHRVGIDLSAGMLAIAKGRGLPVLKADAHHLPFGAKTIDAVVSSYGVFLHLDLAVTMAECARVLRPGGRVVLEHFAAWSWSPRRPHKWRGTGTDPRRIESLNDIIAPSVRCGFVVESTRLWRCISLPPYYVPLPPWLPGPFWDHCSVVFRRP